MTDGPREPARANRRPLRVLIVAAHYPPVNAVAATRPAQWARLLQQRGCAVSVLTTEVRRGTLQGCDLEVPAGEVIRVAVPGTNIIGWVDRASVESDHGSRQQSPRRLGILARLTQWLRRSRGTFSSARMPDHHDLWTIAALRRIRGRRWDAVISTHGPYACHAVAYWLRRNRRVSWWIADYRDLWVNNHIYPGLFPFTLLERGLEKIFCRNADKITTVSDGLASQLAQRHGRAVEVLHNTIDLDVFRRLDAAPVFPLDGQVRFVYTGTVYPVGQSPELLFRALALVREHAPVEFARLRLVFAGKSQANVRDLAVHYDMIDILEQPGQVPRTVALRMQRDADALLFFGFYAAGHAGILTSKLFEYLASGTRILAVSERCDDSITKLLKESQRASEPGPKITDIASEIVRIVRESSAEAKYVLESTRVVVDSERSGDVLLRLLRGLCSETPRGQ